MLYSGTSLLCADVCVCAYVCMCILSAPLDSVACVHVSVCVRGSENEKERERESVCVCLCVCARKSAWCMFNGSL